MATSSYENEFATTVGACYDDLRYAARARLIEVPKHLHMLPPDRFYLRDELKLLARILRAALQRKTLLLFSSTGHLKVELLASVLLGFWPRRFRPLVVFYGEMFEPNSGWRGRGERLMLKLADRAITCYVVYSSAELEVFPRLWNIDAGKMRLCPFFRAEESAPREAHARGRHIFAGGNSFRDYGPLVEAARQLPDYEFVICTNRLGTLGELPPNVRAGLVPHEEYVELIDSAAAVVVPVQVGLHRTAGLLTILESMWHKRPTIVSDAFGVREYVRDGETGLVVDGSPQSYGAAIRWMLEPTHAPLVARMGEQAHRAVAEQFSLDAHVSRLLAIMDEVMPLTTPLPDGEVRDPQPS